VDHNSPVREKKNQKTRALVVGFTAPSSKPGALHRRYAITLFFGWWMVDDTAGLGSLSARID